MKRERFVEIHIGMDEKEKKEICCWIWGQPYSWNVCALEILAGTKLGDAMLAVIPYHERQRRLK